MEFISGLWTICIFPFLLIACSKFSEMKMNYSFTFEKEYILPLLKGSWNPLKSVYLLLVTLVSVLSFIHKRIC